VGRDDEIQAIVEIGRRTRKPNPRWLWVAATVVGVVCAAGFVVAMLGTPGASGDPPGAAASDPPGRLPRHSPGRSVDGRAGWGLGTGLVLGVGAAIVIGGAVARQRRRHSSRKIP
jgi:hypothetical protein